MQSHETDPRPRPERALDAALEILGDLGVRGLTHARVDKVADLPAGSTSNYFRTRSSLLEGTVAHLARLERADFAGAWPALDRAAAEDAIVAMLEAQSGHHRSRTLARYALFVDLADEEAQADPLRENRRALEGWTAATLAALGAVDPAEAASFLMATVDGALLHVIAIDPTVALRPIVARALDACLVGADESTSPDA